MQRRSETMPSSVRLFYFLIIATFCFMATTVSAQEKALADIEKLEGEFSQAYEGEEYAKALGIAEAMNEIIAPKHVKILYNIAALHSLLGNKEKAYEWLDEALNSGYWDLAHLIKDEDFENLRGEERFRAMVRSTGIERYITMLERDEREGFQKPDEVMAVLAFRPGEQVADVGAGSGYFTIPVAKAVGQTGWVWAVDIRQEMLDYIQNRVEEEELFNVQLVLVPEDDPRLPPESMDTILMVDTWHYIQDGVSYAKKLRSALTPGGRIVIIDYKPKPWEERPWGPLPEQQVSRESVDAAMAEAGLKPIKVYDFLPEQYFVEYGVE